MSEKILIVDSEPDMLILLSMLIKEKILYEPVTTNNPLEALELIKQGDFDLVIAGLKMPGLDEIELLDAIKHIDKDIPVIIVATNGTFESAIETMQKGSFDYIAKPFRKEQILFSIDKALKCARLKKENRMLIERLKSLIVDGV